MNKIAMIYKQDGAVFWDFNTKAVFRRNLKSTSESFVELFGLNNQSTLI